MLQIVMMSLILVVLVLILGVFILSLMIPPGGKSGMSMEETLQALKVNRKYDMEGSDKSLDELVRIMRENADKEAREEREKELVDFAKNKLKGSPGEIRVNGQGTGPVTSGKEYIPYNLSERDKAILRAFNGS